MYYLYIVECFDGTLYTGITTDPKRRVAEHNGANKLGARYTAGRRPVKLVYTRKFKTRSAALKEEAHMKKMGRAEKLALIGKL